MESLSPECTSLKHRYDQCFNAWFEGYLKPIVIPHVEDATPESDIEQEEADSLAASELFVEEEDELCEGEEEQDVPHTSSIPSGSIGSTHHQGPHHHHYPSWSLRNDDKHPDLWPYSARHIVSKSTTVHAAKDSPVEQTNLAARSGVPDQILEQEVEADLSVHDLAIPSESKSSAAVNPKPVVTIPLTTSSPKEQRAEWARAKKEEYDRNCGALWTDYRECLRASLYFVLRLFARPTSKCRAILTI
ncbi:hypothetical protein QFC19_001214 [Naganishia cerealis]|uniref:Uncharacterized protein n=1 Tax=Naganishia cerealis TaxID=610337 RepID=A0ACC2WI73_9TREE|nr:hypothetical protein QFC19_001214 [Naganishia cerealis]